MTLNGEYNHIFIVQTPYFPNTCTKTKSHYFPNRTLYIPYLWGKLNVKDAWTQWCALLSADVIVTGPTSHVMSYVSVKLIQSQEKPDALVMTHVTLCFKGTGTNWSWIYQGRNEKNGTLISKAYKAIFQPTPAVVSEEGITQYAKHS